MFHSWMYHFVLLFQNACSVLTFCGFDLCYCWILMTALLFTNSFWMFVINSHETSQKNLIFVLPLSALFYIKIKRFVSNCVGRYSPLFHIKIYNKRWTINSTKILKMSFNYLFFTGQYIPVEVNNNYCSGSITVL